MMNQFLRQTLHGFVHCGADLFIDAINKCFKDGWSIRTATRPSLPSWETVERCVSFGLFSLSVCTHDPPLLFGFKIGFALVVLFYQVWTFKQAPKPETYIQEATFLGWLGSLWENTVQGSKESARKIRNHWKQVAFHAFVCFAIAAFFKEPVTVMIFAIISLPIAGSLWELCDDASLIKATISGAFLISMICTYLLKEVGLASASSASLLNNTVA